MRDGRLLGRLERCLSALAHWAPVTAELDFAPALAYPFVRLFGADELAAFETVMAVLTHWGRDWLATFPVPPVPLLSLVARQLQHADAPLASHLERLRVSVQEYAWPMLRSVMTEVLDKEQVSGGGGGSPAPRCAQCSRRRCRRRPRLPSPLPRSG